MKLWKSKKDKELEAKQEEQQLDKMLSLIEQEIANSDMIEREVKKRNLSKTAIHNVIFDKYSLASKKKN